MTDNFDIYDDTQAEDNLLHEVQDLVWALVDEYINDQQVQRLHDLLLEDEEARRIYVQCMQLHSDLYYQFGGQNREKSIGDLAAALGLPESTFTNTSTMATPTMDLDLPTDGLTNNSSGGV